MGGVIICLDCQAPKLNCAEFVGLCDDPVCSSATLSTAISDHSLARSHLPSHDVVKLRTIYQRRTWPAIDQEARRLLKLWRNTQPEEPSQASLTESNVTGHIDDLTVKTSGASDTDTEVLPQDLPEDASSVPYSTASHARSTITLSSLDSRTLNGSFTASLSSTASHSCAVCCSPISQSCWYCIECSGMCLRSYRVSVGLTLFDRLLPM